MIFTNNSFSMKFSINLIRYNNLLGHRKDILQIICPETQSWPQHNDSVSKRVVILSWWKCFLARTASVKYLLIAILNFCFFAHQWLPNIYQSNKTIVSLYLIEVQKFIKLLDKLLRYQIPTKNWVYFFRGWKNAIFDRLRAHSFQIK